jgi:hypothetical protein
MGYRNVRHYPGGLTEWFADGQPVSIQPRSTVASAPATTPSRAARPPSAVPAVTRFIDALSDRSVGALFRLWLEIVIGCGVAYWALNESSLGVMMSGGTRIPTGVGSLWSAIYFSAVTATSVGYGDIVPSGVARVLAIAEGIAGLILFGCVVSKFVSRRQEELLAETHRIAFEDRLGRVRTNLHLVRTEIQETSRICEGRAVPPPQALVRVESASMIFVGELRAVHDLLYRPQASPDEAVLEAILASLASVFREFIELMRCVTVARDSRSPAFASSLASMTRLAREVCGDCVPREFAPSLTTWMDQIQRMADEVEQI